MDPGTGRGEPGADEVVIRPVESDLVADLSATWRFRHLIGAMASRQFRVDYAGAALGWVWIWARPVAMLVIFTVFRRLSSAQVGETMAYPLYLYSGLVLWFFFTNAAESAANALERDAGLIRKVYFPRLVSPLASVLAELMALAVSALPLVALMLWYGVQLSWTLALLPLLAVQIAMLVVGIGAIVSVLSLQSPDWRRVLTLLLYIGLFVSPVIYAPSMIPPAVRTAFGCNPMVGSLMAFRAMLDARESFPTTEWAYSWAASALIFFFGVAVFHRFERHMLDKL